VSLQNSLPLLLGHRGVRPLPLLGLRWRKPDLPAENTLAAFEYAMHNGCDGVEFDVRYTRDRRSILWHEAKLKGSEVAATDHNGLERRYGNELASLTDVLVRFGESAWLDIELKALGEEEAVAAALHAHPPQRGYVVSSFVPEVLLRLHEIDSSLPLGYICERPEDVQRWTGLPIVAFIPHHSLVSMRLIDEVHACQKQLLTWTVNQRDDLLRLAAWGVNGLISDDPKLLSRTFPKVRAATAS
jgi:glycerophosphoryl diester phosphodiesterase